MSVAYETSFTMRGATGITLQPHQILRLSRKMTLMIDVRHTWHVIYNARSNRSHPPTSPNTAPATQNDSHDWCPSHMKRHLQCAEQQASPSNLTKYCACHAKWLSWLIFVTYETSFAMRGGTGITLQPHQILRLPRKMTFQNLRKMCRKQLKRQFQCGDGSSMIRTWIRAWTRHLAPARSPRLLFALRRRILYWKLQHFALRLSTQISPNTAPATKSDTPTLPNAAPATKSDTPTSPNTAPATQNDSHDWCPSHLKRHLQCAEHQASPSNLTKYCACHAKVHSKIKEKCAENSWSVNSNAGTIRAWSEHDPSMNSSSRTRPFAEVTFRASETHFVLKITTFRAPAIYPNFTKSCACHQKWHSDITKYCACHEKWHSDITKCCACHEKWHSDITKYCACHELGLETWMHRYFTVTFTALLLYCYFYCTVTFTALLLYCYFYCTVTFTALLLYCYFYCFFKSP